MVELIEFDNELPLCLNEFDDIFASSITTNK